MPDHRSDPSAWADEAWQSLSMRYGTPDAELQRAFAMTPPELDGPIWMVNLMRYRERADYADGRHSELSGIEADDLYAPLDSLAAVGAEVALFAEVEQQLLGRVPPWDRVAVVKYPSRRSFVEMQRRADFRAHHLHKDAGMAATIVIATRPFAPPPLPAGAPTLDEVPHPSSDEDPAVLVCHVVAFDHHDAELDQSIQHMEAYQEHAARIAVPHGVRISGWFEAEGTIVGDGRHWDQVRFNAFPSRAAFMAVVTDPERLEAQRAHREVAMSDTYTLILRPLIDRLAESWRDEELVR